MEITGSECSSDMAGLKSIKVHILITKCQIQLKWKFLSRFLTNTTQKVLFSMYPLIFKDLNLTAVSQKGYVDVIGQGH